MRGENAFTVEGFVTEVLSERTCRAELANGHVVFGFMPARVARTQQLILGLKVNLKLSPYDLSEGQILVDKNRT